MKSELRAAGAAGADAVGVVMGKSSRSYVFHAIVLCCFYSLTTRRYGRDRPSNRCVAPGKRTQVVSRHRPARGAHGAGGEASGGSAASRGGSPKLVRDRRPGGDRG